MNWKEIASRLKGFSTPLGGVDFDMPEPEVSVARRVIAMLEDRRVLYASHVLETPEACIGSANDIRHSLTDEIGRIQGDSQLRSILQGIRRAARDLVTAIESRGENRMGRVMQSPWSAAEFGIALGQFRSTVGTYVAILASTYKLDVDGDLAHILPPKISDRDA
jgi:hypothetical protein